MENAQPKTPADVLRAAKALIETKGWTQGSAARDAKGYEVTPRAITAACFCGLGAVNAVSCGVGVLESKAHDYLDETVPEVTWFPDFNDAPGRTKEEVLAKFDEAIALAEAQA